MFYTYEFEVFKSDGLLVAGPKVGRPRVNA